MKKSFLLIFSLVLCATVFAQENVNRMIVNSGWDKEAYKIEAVDSITFATVEGEVAADLAVLDVTLDKVTLEVTRTASCHAFKISCFPAVVVKGLDDASLASSIDGDSQNVYYQDFEQAEMTGMTFLGNTDYTIATVGLDQYGVLCDVRRETFTTPAAEVLGDPKVEYEVTDVQLQQFSVKFTPNDDVSAYYVLAGEEATLQQQFEMFAPMFGFANFGQMIQMWGAQPSPDDDNIFTWTQMAANTTYKVYIQALDANGVMAPYQEFEVSTLALGGEGEATVEITLGEYKLADWWGEMLPSQFFTFTPNDQASCYRFSVYFAADYDGNEEAIANDLRSDPPMPMSGWFFYEPVTTDYQINPSTECVAIAAAKNINGEWGPVTELRFTTPEEAAEGDTPANVSSKIGKRTFGKPISIEGKVPDIKVNKGMQLIAK